MLGRIISSRTTVGQFLASSHFLVDMSCQGLDPYGTGMCICSHTAGGPLYQGSTSPGLLQALEAVTVGCDDISTDLWP